MRSELCLPIGFLFISCQSAKQGLHNRYLAIKSFSSLSNARLCKSGFFFPFDSEVSEYIDTSRSLKFSNLHLFMNSTLLRTLSLSFDPGYGDFWTISTLSVTPGPPISSFSASEPRVAVTFLIGATAAMKQVALFLYYIQTMANVFHSLTHSLTFH